MVSNNGDTESDLSIRLNKLEGQVIKLTDQVKIYKKSVSELKSTISQRDAQIYELELKLGYAQQSLLEKITDKIQECRTQIKTGINQKLIAPTVTHIQQHIKTAHAFVDEAKILLIEKKTQVDKHILTAKDKVVECPGFAKSYVEKTIISPTQMAFQQTCEIVAQQIKTTRTAIEDNAIYPGKLLLEEVVATGQSLPAKLEQAIKKQALDPINKATKKAVKIYPDTLAYLGKAASFLDDICKQALFEITAQVKKSPLWDGKNRLKASY